ncbi:c-type cytochrome [Corallococcus sp. M34]|uniref:cytochrome-c peroxidase n=1 Tax=Citreicoccus inhibens TaxID=2849499 RepID=UPI001C22C484|nr:cytochrome c peroxidase [Citreicoccus inhibens]MBU8898367.1 c-type cytochrome [Citreicoccus inhibens]
MIRALCGSAIWAGILLVTPVLAFAEGQPAPTSSRAAAALGEALFFDTALSADGTVACATCHRPDAAFADSQSVTAGVLGRRGTRNAPGLMGAGRLRELFWDGRRASLEELVIDPLTTPEEHGFADMNAAVAIVRARHAAGFARVFPGGEVTPERVAQALASYVRGLVPAPSAFDRYLAGDIEALRPAQRRGLALFSGRAGCARCHRLEEGALTDGAYHAGEVLPALVPRLAAAARDAARMPSEARRAAVPARVEVAALGRYVATLRTADIGRFRTPSLRNVAVTAPYMHDGSVPTLAQAVERELYYRVNEGLRVGDLTPAERMDLVEFLQALTSPGTPPGRTAAAPTVR